MDFERAYTLRIIINNLINKLTNARSAILESRWAVIGSFFIFFGIILFIVQFISPHFFSLRFETGLVGLSLGLLSVGVAIYAIHLSKKTDRKHTELLKRITVQISELPETLGNDTIALPILDGSEELIEILEKLNQEKLSELKLEEERREELKLKEERLRAEILLAELPREEKRLRELKLEEERLEEERRKIDRPEKYSKSAAKRRLDEDTKRVGYKRGEIYEIGDGKWGVNWGGKYPL